MSRARSTRCSTVRQTGTRRMWARARSPPRRAFMPPRSPRTRQPMSMSYLISAAEGIGPVNALDLALRKDLGKYQKYIGGLELTDYRVRILNGGTEAVTRVLIESQDETGERWTTVGVSPNIIDASFQALMDSIIYKLVRSGAPA